MSEPFSQGDVTRHPLDSSQVTEFLEERTVNDCSTLQLVEELGVS